MQWDCTVTEIDGIEHTIILMHKRIQGVHINVVYYCNKELSYVVRQFSRIWTRLLCLLCHNGRPTYWYNSILELNSVLEQVEGKIRTQELGEGNTATRRKDSILSLYSRSLLRQLFNFFYFFCDATEIKYKHETPSSPL